MAYINTYLNFIFVKKIESTIKSKLKVNHKINRYTGPSELLGPARSLQGITLPVDYKRQLEVQTDTTEFYPNY